MQLIILLSAKEIQRIIMLEQNVFNIATLSFDDNKVLKVLVMSKQIREKEFTREAYVASQSLKNSEDHQKLTVRV
jgi:hypothetical protein